MGIGRCFCNILAENGINIVAVARNQDNLNKLKTEIEGQYSVEVLTLSLDLTKEESAAIIEKETLHIDIGLLIANAGIENDGFFPSNSRQDELNLIALNVRSPLQLSHIFSNRFISRGKGGMIFLSSLFGYQGVPYFANYSASKAYTLAFGEALHVELAPHNVDVLVVSPGLTETAMPAGISIDFKKMPITSHQPEIVAQVAFGALGKKPSVVVGFFNKCYAWANRLYPRIFPSKLFGFLIRNARTEALDEPTLLSD